MGQWREKKLREKPLPFNFWVEAKNLTFVKHLGYETDKDALKSDKYELRL
jgi:hypothetical protein